MDGIGVAVAPDRDRVRSGRLPCAPIRLNGPMGSTESGSRRLLVGYGPGEHGEDALVLAAVLCELTGARPTILRVLPVARYLLGDDPDLALDLETREPLAVARERLARFDPATRAACGSSVARSFFTVAEEEGSALIVVGSTHRGKLDRLLAGNTATALLQGAPAAVAVAPLGYARRPEHKLARIGVAVDGSEESRSALAGAIELADAAGAELRLLSAVEPSAFGYGELIESLTAGEVSSQATEHAKGALADAAAAVPEGITAHTHLIHGDIGAALDEESARLDLLLLGSRGYGPIRRTLLGSVSAHVVGHARCPVLIVPRGVGELPFDAGAD